MAKQTRQKISSIASNVRSRVPKKTRAAAKQSTSKPAATPRRRAGARGHAAPSQPVARPGGAPAAGTTAPPPKKPGYYEALAMYENGVRALQRHDYEGAAAQFRTIIERYPDERELQERSQLYLRVCERETARRPSAPQTPQERVYAATVALNAGDTAAAMDHLHRALIDAPDSDHGHYIMAVALASKGESARALEHLRRAITLNPDNRSLARQDPDLEAIRATDGFAALVDVPELARTKTRKRR